MLTVRTCGLSAAACGPLSGHVEVDATKEYVVKDMPKIDTKNYDVAMVLTKKGEVPDKDGKVKSKTVPISGYNIDKAK